MLPAWLSAQTIIAASQPVDVWFGVALTMMHACADAASEEGDLVKRRILADLRHALLVDHRVLRECRRALQHGGGVDTTVRPMCAKANATWQCRRNI